MKWFRRHGPVLEVCVHRGDPALVYISWMTFRFEVGRFLRKLAIRYKFDGWDWGVAEWPEEKD